MTTTKFIYSFWTAASDGEIVVIVRVNKNKNQCIFLKMVWVLFKNIIIDNWELILKVQEGSVQSDNHEINFINNAINEI